MGGFSTSWLRSWMRGWAHKESVDDLVTTLDRTLGHSWFSRDDLHAQVAKLIDQLRVEAMSLPGMTMNERLLAFGLLAAWDSASDAKRETLRSKLGAS